MGNSVKFDPGMGSLVIDFNSFINDIYSHLMGLRTIHQKRAYFKLYISKIKKSMQNNISFYFGCLLWAYYIYNANINEPEKIDGNPFLNMTEEQKNDYDYMIQVNFTENYFDSYERDSLYYTGQKLLIPKKWKEILSLYSEFIKLNNGFIKTSLTSDIILPDRLKSMSFDFDINLLIQNSINKKDLSILIENINNFTL